MSPWGLACIAPNLTHMAGATQDNNTWGYSPENLARNRACQAVLATRSDVDVSRLAMWGHSRGAFAAIGIASDFGHDLKALGFSAGGIHETADLSEPNAAEASNITAPTILFHGSTDTIVPPADSARLQTLLNTLGVTNTRVLFDTTGITPSTNAHNIHQVSTINTDMLMQWRAWLTTHGVLP
jgi:dipeptidyl aminopeptidase/acylaminoacyl peptidase